LSRRQLHHGPSHLAGAGGTDSSSHGRRGRAAHGWPAVANMGGAGRQNSGSGFQAKVTLALCNIWEGAFARRAKRAPWSGSLGAWTTRGARLSPQEGDLRRGAAKGQIDTLATAGSLFATRRGPAAGHCKGPDRLARYRWFSLDATAGSLQKPPAGLLSHAQVGQLVPFRKTRCCPSHRVVTTSSPRCHFTRPAESAANP
jgi:hypothetical protein